MIIDGKKIAEKIKQELKREIETSSKKLKLAIVQVGPVRSSQSKIDAEIVEQFRTSNGIGENPSDIFVKQKVKFAEDIGVKTRIYNLPENISTNQLRRKMAEICHIKENDGVILQLPLPEHINTQYVLNSIIPKKDVDVLSSRSFGDFATGHSKILPPLVGVIKIIFETYSVEPAGKNIVVIGRGILVGKPIANWLINEGATVSILNSKTKDISKFTKEADIIISGVGKPNLVKPNMVKDEVIIIDAGSLIGDIEPEVAEKSSLFMPVPGGVGPLTVAMVFKNLIKLNK
jgi:methylenetetrahydrofolate dehydrogenase (NADP+)/methenyltetrahydrofolate cyclohydrolase